MNRLNSQCVKIRKHFISISETCTFELGTPKIGDMAVDGTAVAFTTSDRIRQLNDIDKVR